MRHSIAATPSPCRSRLSFGINSNGPAEPMVVPIKNSKCDPYWGATIRKSFGGTQIFYGQVVNVDADVQTGARAYHVLYEDGDEEHLDEIEIRKFFVPRHYDNSAPASHRSSITSLSGAPTPRTPIAAPYVGHSEWNMPHAGDRGGVQNWQYYGGTNSATYLAPAPFNGFGPVGAFFAVSFALVAFAWGVSSWSHAPAAATIAASHIHSNAVWEATQTPQAFEIRVPETTPAPLRMHGNSEHMAIMGEFVPPPPPWMHEVAAVPKAPTTPTPMDDFDPWAGERLSTPIIPQKPARTGSLFNEDSDIAPPLPPWSTSDATPVVKSHEELDRDEGHCSWPCVVQAMRTEADLAMKGAAVAGRAVLMATKFLSGVVTHKWEAAAGAGHEHLLLVILGFLAILSSSICCTRPLMANPRTIACHDMVASASIIESDGGTADESPFLYGSPPGVKEDSFMPEPPSPVGPCLHASYAPVDLKTVPITVKSECFQLPESMDTSAMSSMAAWPAQPPSPAALVHPTVEPLRTIAPSPLAKKVLASASIKKSWPSPSPLMGPSPSLLLTKEPMHLPSIASPQKRGPKESITSGTGNQLLQSPASIRVPKVAQQGKTRRSAINTAPINTAPINSRPRFRFTDSLNKLKEMGLNVSEADMKDVLTRHRGKIPETISELGRKGFC